MQQDDLFEALEIDAKVGDKSLEIIEKSVHSDRVGLKNFAFLIKRDPQQIRDALNSNGKHFSVKWVPILIRRDPEFATAYINFLCDLAGKEHPGDRKALTPEEELAQIKETIQKHGLQTLFKGNQ